METPLVETDEMTFDQKYDLLLEKNGGFGFFQWFTSFVLISGMLGSGWFFYGLTYYELWPQYECYN